LSITPTIKMQKIALNNKQKSRFNKELFSYNSADFQIREAIFVVGGISRNKRQIAQLSDTNVAKDDIEYGYMSVLPLWSF